MQAGPGASDAAAVSLPQAAARPESHDPLAGKPRHDSLLEKRAVT
jgi:hypothetical protein